MTLIERTLVLLYTKVIAFCFARIKKIEYAERKRFYDNLIRQIQTKIKKQ